MSAPVRPPLSVTDGTTTVRPTNKIVFDAADGFSVTKNGTDARIDLTAGGTIGGSIASTQVAFGSGSNTIEGESNFVYDKSTDAMKVDKIGVGAVVAASVADNNPVLQVAGSMAAAKPVILTTGTTLDISSTANAMKGQLYAFTNGSTITFTIPNSAAKGDYLKFVGTGGDVTISLASGASINGVSGPTTLTRGTNNQVYEIYAIDTDKYILSNP